MDSPDVCVVVNGASGRVCVAHGAQRSWSILRLKEEVQKVKSIPCDEQILIDGFRELKDEELVEGLWEVTLVRRSAQEAAWLRLAQEDWSALLKEPEAWQYRSVVLAAVRSSGWALQHAAALRADAEVVRAAVEQNGLALQFADAALARDPDLVLAAAARSGRAFAFAAEELRTSRSFALKAVARNGHVLKYVDEAMRDEELVEAAVVSTESSALAEVLGKKEALRHRIKHVLQDRGVLGAEGPMLAPPPSEDLGVCVFGLGLGDSQLGAPSRLGKEASALCELSSLGLPVPLGFCAESWASAKRGLSYMETSLKQRLGCVQQPLLLSVRRGDLEVSGVGLTDAVAEHLARTGNANCVWDSYRRLVLSYASSVAKLPLAPFEEPLAALKRKLSAADWLGGELETYLLPTQELQTLVESYKVIFQEYSGEVFPQDPQTQLRRSLEALGATEAEGEAVVVQSMVFGNYDFDSGVGKLKLTEGSLEGQWVPKAQREDLETRGPGQPLTAAASRAWAAARGVPEARRAEQLSLEEQLLPICAGLAHCKDVLCRAKHLDISAVDFAVQQGRLWLLGASKETPSLCSDDVSTCDGDSACGEASVAGEDRVFRFFLPPWVLGARPFAFAKLRPSVGVRPGVRSVSGVSLGLLRRVRKPRPVTTPPKAAAATTPAAPALAPGLALPLWQTALAGGAACVGHRATCATLEELLAQRSAKLAPSALARNLLRFAPAGLPFGGACCSFYVNFLALAGRDGEAVGLVQRFSCASAAVTLASVATHPLTANFQLGSLRALRRQACQAVRSANPVAALEMCSIDVVRHLGAENGFSHGPGLLFASGCMAGCFAQSVVHVHDAVNQKRERRRELLANLRSVVPAMLKHAPAVGVNSVVRVGLVTHFLSQ